MSFSLNIAGDSIILMHGNMIIDEVAWERGTSGGIPINWESSSLPFTKENMSIQRISLNIDTDSHQDWGSNKEPTPGL